MTISITNCKGVEPQVITATDKTVSLQQNKGEQAVLTQAEFNQLYSLEFKGKCPYLSEEYFFANGTQFYLGREDTQYEKILRWENQG